MTIWYMDYEQGIDSNASVGNGDSFATRRKKIDNFVAAAIGPGDEIRIMASPTPSLVGNATWTDGPLADLQSLENCTNSTPIVVTKSVHGWSNGDTVLINGQTSVTYANGVWQIANVTTNTFELVGSIGNGTAGTSGQARKVTNAVVTLAAPVTKNIALCGNRGTKTNWTSADGTNVTNTVRTADYKEGCECQQIAIAAGFTTGKAAYLPITSLDLSAYQQVSFWVKQTAGTIGAAGATRLRLCTDTAGATPVHDIPIPALGALTRWVPVVVDLGTNLNAAIQSVSFDVVTDNGAQTFLLDNIIACKASSAADSLNLTSLISKDPGNHSFGDGYECWWGIQSINGTRVVLDGPVNTILGSSPQRGYSGTTETVATYKRETIKTVPLATANTNGQAPQDFGTSGSLIAFTGGWNRTDMSTQTGETWFDGQNGLGYAVADGSKSFLSFDKINFTRYAYGFITVGSGTDWSIGRNEVCNISNSAFSGNTRLTATTLSAVSCGGSIQPGAAAIVQTIGRADSTTSGNGVTLGAGSWTGTVKSASNNAGSGVQAGVSGYVGLATLRNNASNQYITGSKSVIGELLVTGNAAQFTYAVQHAASFCALILGGASTGNTSGGVSTTSGTCTLRNFTINEATEAGGFTAYNDGRVYSEKHDGTTNNSVIFCDGGMIRTDATQTHSTASYSWKFSPTSANRSQYYPLNQSIAKVACAANALVTIRAWFRRDNTGLTGKLVCKGGQISGVSADVTASMTEVANTWQQLTITFTPTESGVVDIEAQFWGGASYNGWVSDLDIAQA